MFAAWSGVPTSFPQVDSGERRLWLDPKVASSPRKVCYRRLSAVCLGHPEVPLQGSSSWLSFPSIHLQGPRIWPGYYNTGTPRQRNRR